ncbi:hypothetical protein [Pseudorhodoferax sp.]|uniref:hypothetical protein n=1 Tax=Pseudorhodoferax sp. TaxID=1993553 RepID=UPI0039E4667A
MRKSLSIVLSAVVLACAGVSQASVDGGPRVSGVDSFTLRVQQFTGWLQPSADTLRGTGTAASGGPRSSTPSASTSTSEEEDNQLMLLVSLMIMAVIIRRHYGTRE